MAKFYDAPVFDRYEKSNFSAQTKAGITKRT